MSKARTRTLEPLLQDVDEVNLAHQRLRTGLPGRQWNLSGLNRSAIVLTVSAWEAYVEDLAVECVEALRPASQAQNSSGQPWPLDVWPAISALTRDRVGRFNTPNSKNVVALFSAAIGLSNVALGWSYKGCSQTMAVAHLDDLLTMRHRIAHGVNPRPSVRASYATWAPRFIRNIADCTDSTVRDHLETVLGVSAPW